MSWYCCATLSQIGTILPGQVINVTIISLNWTSSPTPESERLFLRQLRWCKKNGTKTLVLEEGLRFTQRILSAYIPCNLQIIGVHIRRSPKAGPTHCSSSIPCLIYYAHKRVKSQGTWLAPATPSNPSRPRSGVMRKNFCMARHGFYLLLQQ